MFSHHFATGMMSSSTLVGGPGSLLCQVRVTSAGSRFKPQKKKKKKKASLCGVHSLLYCVSLDTHLVLDMNIKNSSMGELYSSDLGQGVNVCCFDKTMLT
jgi:hypothetical protein